MIGFIIFVALVLLFVVLAQVARVTDIVARIKGDDDFEQIGKTQASMLLIFLVGGFIAIYASIEVAKDRMLGTAASEHGHLVDDNFNLTLIFTGIVFVITQILLVVYTYKYRQQKGRKAFFFPGSNKLEAIWTAVPAIVLTMLVVKGVSAWYTITGPAPDNAMTVEAVGQQFAWNLHYPGKDGKLGKSHFTLVNENNPIGLDWSDPASHDDLLVTEMHMAVDRPVHVKIRALDVLHSFNLPHFRVKMDAVPGIPTRFWFTPNITSEDYKVLMEEEGKVFSVFELACTELCGSGHNSMRRLVVVETEEEYKAWEAKQTPFYELVKDQLGVKEESVNETIAEASAEH